MRKNKNSKLVKILCIVICFTFVLMSASSMVFAKENVSKADKDQKKVSDKIKKDTSIQTLILDSMQSKKNNEIANLLSSCTEESISETSESLASILKGDWDSKKGEAALKNILSDYLGYTPKAKLAITMIIREGFKGVELPDYLSAKINSKINTDITGDPADNRGIKFMVKALQILQNIASLNNEKFVTLSFDPQAEISIELNRLEGYSYLTSSISEVLGTLQDLPFKKKNFESFVTYYEKYLNSCSSYEVISFLYLLKANDIPYSIDLE